MVSPDSRANLARRQAEIPLNALCKKPRPALFAGVARQQPTSGKGVTFAGPSAPPLDEAPYRSRAVLDPRSVLSEFGLNVPTSKEIRVWDSTAEIRYLVIPQRPGGTEGWAVERLATLVTRDSMIGAGLALDPQTGGESS